jgi:chloramphenicol 3-O-phosphotransferase
MGAQYLQDLAVGHVIWINGSFSTGKTTVANLLVKRIPGSFLLDPEAIGGVLRDHLVPPSIYPGDFQDLRLWRFFAREAILDAAERSEHVIVVPMTIARPDYFDEIIGAIRARVRLEHFTLMASRETILRREASRSDDTGDWAARTVDRVLPELAKSRYSEHLDAETQSPGSVAAEILNRAHKS